MAVGRLKQSWQYDFKLPGFDAYEHVWKRIKPELGHLYILVRAVLRFLWKRGRLARDRRRSRRFRFRATMLAQRGHVANGFV